MIKPLTTLAALATASACVASDDFTSREPPQTIDNVIDAGPRLPLDARVATTEHAVGELPLLDVTVLIGQWGAAAVDPLGGVVVVQPHAQSNENPGDITLDEPDNTYFSVRHTQADGEETWLAQLPGLELGGILAPAPKTAVVFGAFQRTLDLGGVTLDSTANPGAEYGSATPFQDDDFQRGSASLDGFVLKLEGESLAWAKPFSGYGPQRVLVGTVMEDGDILLAGNFVADMSVGPLTIRHPLQSSRPTSFLARLNAQGEAVALTPFAGEHPLSIASNSDGVAVVATRTPSADGDEEMALTRFDQSGEELSQLTWNRRAGELGGIALDAEGNVYLAVQANDFQSELFFGQQLSNEYALVKLTPSGEVSWFARFPGTPIAPSVAVHGESLSFAGQMTTTTDFGGGPLTAPSAEGSIFFAEFDLEGAHRYSLTFGEQAGVGQVIASLHGWVFPFYVSTPLQLAASTPQIPAGEHVMMLRKSAR